METDKYKDLLIRFNKLRTFENYNGIHLTELSETHARADVELTEDSLNPFNMPHGGLLFTLCDIVTGALAISSGKAAVTLSSNMEFLRISYSKHLHAIGTIARNGKSIGLFDARVLDDQGNLLSRGSFQYYYSGMPLAFKDDL